MSISQAAFYGGSIELTITTDQRVNVGKARLWVLTTSTSSLSVLMPKATDSRIRPGRPGVFVVNDASSTQDLVIEDYGGTAITLSDGAATLAPGEIASMFLADESDEDGEWFGKVETVNAVQDSGPEAITYCFGGTLTGTTTWAFDQQLETWSVKTNTDYDHYYSGGFTVGTAGYYIGSDTAGVRDKISKYDPDTHTALTDLTFGDCSRGQLCASASKGYVLGHLYNKDGTYEYDTGGDAWTTKSSKTTDCTRGRGVLLGGSPFVFHGEAVTNNPLGDVEAFNISGDSWSSKTPGSTPFVSTFALFAIDDIAYKVGGEDASLDDMDDVKKYDEGLDTWSTKSDFNKGVSAHYGSSPEGDGLVTNGWANTFRDDCYEYGEIADTWTQHDDAPGNDAHVTQLAIKP